MGANDRQAPVGSGAMLRLIRDGHASTRAELVELTGMARSTVAQRMESLVAHRLVVPAGGSPSTGGRPPTAFVFNRGAGVVLAADLGATHSRLAVCDLGGEILVEHAEDRAIATGPETILAWLDESFERMLDEAGRAAGDVRGVGVGVPGPVEFEAGMAVNAPIMPGWDGFPVAERMRERWSAPALVDNDANIMAVGEHWSRWRDADHLLFVKVGTGIGSGVVVDGHIHRGAQGAAGDIGHIQVTQDESVVCRCGNVGCLEAIAGGNAMAARLSALGFEAGDARDVVRHVRGGVPEAVRLVRQAGRDLGEVLAGAVNLVNPSVIVIGGDVAEAHEQLLAGVREVVYQRSLPLATPHLRIVTSQTGRAAGVLGASVMAVDHVLSAAAIDAAIG
jgi:predicted NBD/HSP70 family sugar kinase